MRASAFAGISIAQTATSIPHGLSYPVTYNLNISHGMACGYFLSAFIEAAPEELKQHILYLTDFKDAKDMHFFIKDILHFMPISDDTLQIAKKELCSNQTKLQSAPFLINESVIDSMYENIKSWS
jgi:alcohol dehydrogenase